MIDWNDTNLPNPATLSVTNKSQNLRKKMESGRTVQRQRWSTPLEEGTVTFSFLKEQFQIFKGVWRHYLRNGIDSFLIDLPVGGSEVLTQCEVKFVSDFTYKYRSIGSVAVQAKIEFAEVETIDELELRNLIDVGELLPAPEGDVFVATFKNNNDFNQGTTIKFMVGTTDLNTDVAYQAWDGTIAIDDNGMPNKTLPYTPYEVIYTVNAFACASPTDPTPTPNVLLNKVAFNSSVFLHEFNHRANYPKHYWVSMDFTSAFNWIMPEANNTFSYPIKSNYERLRMSAIRNMETLRLELEDNAKIFYSVNTDQFDISNNDNFSNFETIPSPNNIKCKLNRVNFRQNDLITVLDLSEYIFVTNNWFGTDYGPVFKLQYNDGLTEVIMNGTEQGGDYGNGQLSISNNALLTTITINGDHPYPIQGIYNDCRYNGLDILSLKGFVDNVRGRSTTTNKIRVTGNPCFVANALFPARARIDINISSITSTATDFTVTTSVSHGLIAGDYTVIAGASVSDYDGLHTVASSTSTTYTVTSTINAGSASGGTTSQEGEQDTAYVEETALANNFYFGS